MGRVYQRLKRLKGSKKAIVAIARKLIIRLRSMPLKNMPYRMGSPAVQQE
jgi:hypothetical protein